MHRIILIAIPVWFACAVGCGRQPATVGPRNILLISIDALRADHMGYAGHHRDTSPFLDRLAAEGTIFRRAFANTHGTPPAHTTMLTSLYQESHRVGIPTQPGQAPDLRVPDGVDTIQEILGRNGWATVAVTGGGYMGREFGFSEGFDLFVDRIKTVKQGTEALLDAIRRSAVDDRPVFALFHTYEVHSPYVSPDKYSGLFGSDTCRIEPTADSLVPLQATAAEHLTPADFDCLAALYDRGIRHTDDTLEILFDELARSGFLDNSLIVITSDHGEEFGEHGGLLHRGSLFDELLHVPLILWGAGIPSGGVESALASTVDIAPTILAWAEVDLPEHMEGRDLLRPSRDADTRRAFAQYGAQLYSIRTHRWKLIVGGEWAHPMLFDVANDPGETRNLAHRHPKVTADLIQELAAWRDARPRLDSPHRPPAAIDSDTREQLEALGYLE